MHDKRPPDLILINANVITLDPFLHRAEAVAICGNRILGVGTNSKARNLTGARTRAIDCTGKTIVPGFIDSHMHLSAFAESLGEFPRVEPCVCCDLSKGLRADMEVCID